MIHMLWERASLLEKEETHRVARFLTPDASPQGGWEYLVCKERMERDLSQGFKRGSPFGGFQWSSQMMPVIVLGAFDTDAVDETLKLAHSARLHSGAAFDVWQKQVKGFLSDQGTERKVNGGARF